MQKANEFLTDMLISKFSRFTGGLGAIHSIENMEELNKDKLLRRDVNIFLSGRMTVPCHIYV